MPYNPAFFSLKSIETYINPFTINDIKYQEYIHCKVVEYLEVDRSNRPEKIKVLQIHNLEDFLKGDETNTSERILEIYKIQPFISHKSSV
ncbi:hypothetical protein [Flavobacterium cerinum]|uniref:WYL domain-containing protein n=1 Tax=Flavobacterium cerinum TaxID=2502784 RepID=A0A444HBY8_9FLAO|nr:hypothetical protein [Flavobacterium cerinum]RWX00984.1 hypothetical protein EPI11_08155 [Flavobacterium cerinum]